MTFIECSSQNAGSCSVGFSSHQDFAMVINTSFNVEVDLLLTSSMDYLVHANVNFIDVASIQLRRMYSTGSCK